MTGRTKLILVLLIGGGAGFLLFRASEKKAESRLTAQIARTYQASAIQTGDRPTFRVELSLPHGSATGNNIEVPEAVYVKLNAGDTYERRVQAISFLGLQAFQHKSTRNGQVVAEWDEGFGLLYIGIGGAGLVAGVVATAVLTVLLGALGLKKAPTV